MRQPSDLYKELCASLESQRDGLVALRHHLHRSPRVSGQEEATREILRQYLAMPTDEIATTGFSLRIGSDDADAVGVRTELDALPITEETGAPYAADNGAMHACGHDIHQAALAGFVMALRTLDEVPVPVTAIGQPREETYPSGAQDIVAEEVLEHERIRAVLALHVHPGLAPGSISTGSGAINASSDEFHLTIHGAGGHGAYPHLTIDPVPVAAQLITVLHGLLRTNVDPVDTATLSVGRVQGGRAPNVIPDSVSVSGTVRAMRPEVRSRLVGQVRELAHRIAEAGGCQADAHIVRGEPVLHNSAEIARAVNPWLQRTGLEIVEPLRSCGADDFSFFTEQVPGLMCFLGVESIGPYPRAGLHSSAFLPPDGTVLAMAKGLAAGYVGLVESWTDLEGIDG